MTKMTDTKLQSPPTVSRSLTSRVYETMRTDIISGALEPGKKLKIEELVRTYEAGNSPVREALSLLVSDALVERLDQRGFRVVQVSSGEFEELLKTRIWLEERALSESIKNGGTDWEEQVVLLNYRLNNTSRSVSKESFVANDEWEVLHKRFHMALIGACGSDILLKFCNQLYDQNTRYRQLSGPSAYPARDINAEHSALAEAVLQRKEEDALALLRAHYQQTSELLFPLL